MGRWLPERTVDPEAAGRALVRHLPELAGAEVRPVGAGWDNAVIAVGPLYLRVTVRAVGDPLMRNEQRLLPTLSDLPRSVPKIRAWGEPEAGLPGPWMAIEPVPGRELAEVLAEGGELADPLALAAFLRALHAPERARSLDWLPHDPLQRAHPDRIADRVHEWVDRALAAGVGLDADAIAALMEADPGAPAMAPCLVHGDLHMRHVLVDGSGACTGIIDWGDACLARPVGDFAALWWGIAPSARTGFLAAYGPVDSATLAHARRFAVFSCLALVVAGMDFGQDAVVAGALRGLARTLEEA